LLDRSGVDVEFVFLVRFFLASDDDEEVVLLFSPLIFLAVSFVLAGIGDAFSMNE
jgi:hypothetical protein